MGINCKLFGKTPLGQPVYLFTLTNSSGMSVGITDFGGIVVSIIVPDKNGHLEDVVLGYDKLEQYFTNKPYFGAIIGRYANRIRNACFELNNEVYALNNNDGINHLHGGISGFDKVLWQSELVMDDEAEALQLTYQSCDGEEGYPGNLAVCVIYTLTENNELEITYNAVTDRDTVVNLTNHSYFNLSGHMSGNILNHQLMINADRFTENDSESVPTGKISSVRGTPMDFNSFIPIGQGIDSDYEQIKFGKGYDHNWVLNNSSKKLGKAAELYDPASGRMLQVFTTMPGLQFYSGNYLDGSDTGKKGVVYYRRGGLCLETQYFPNALEHKHFPTPILHAGEVYNHKTIYRFSTR